MKDYHTTMLGFRDITRTLEHFDQETLSEIRRYDVIRGIMLGKESIVKDYENNDVLMYKFSDKHHGISGRVFANDEILTTNQIVDIIVRTRTDVIRFPELFLKIDAQVYHEFCPGERHLVRVSRHVPSFDPVCIFFNRIPGFIKKRDNPRVYESISLNNVVLTEVLFLKGEITRYSVYLKPLEIQG